VVALAQQVVDGLFGLVTRRSLGGDGDVFGVALPNRRMAAAE
jgi:hypothetical protein